MLEFWFSGFASLLHPEVIAFLILGMAIGLFVGVLPGLGGTTALALLTPVTYGLDPVAALALAGGVMGGVPMGGAVTAILLNTPGQTANAVTCLDGYPLAQQGKAGLAIGAAASANAIGGIIGTISVLARPADRNRPRARLRAAGILPDRAAWPRACRHDHARQDAARPRRRRARIDDRLDRLQRRHRRAALHARHRVSVGRRASRARARRPLRRRRDDASLDQGRHHRQIRQRHPDHRHRRPVCWRRSSTGERSFADR